METASISKSNAGMTSDSATADARCPAPTTGTISSRQRITDITFRDHRPGPLGTQIADCSTEQN